LPVAPDVAPTTVKTGQNVSSFDKNGKNERQVEGLSKPQKMPGFNGSSNDGRYRIRTCDLCRVKATLELLDCVFYVIFATNKLQELSCFLKLQVFWTRFGHRIESKFSNAIVSLANDTTALERYKIAPVRFFLKNLLCK
jgi:hypothetical protein